MSGFYSFLIYRYTEKSNPRLRLTGQSSGLPISSNPRPFNGCRLKSLGRVKLCLEGLFDASRVNFPEISSYMCSGDAESFESLVKDHIFVVQNLVLLGLNCILNHHVA
jgi:hypothetical protein